MDREKIAVQLMQASEFRHKGNDAYTQGHLNDARKHFLTAYQVDLECRQLLGDTPLMLHALATDLMGLRMSLRGNPGEAFIGRKLHNLNLLRREIEGDTPNTLRSLASNLLFMADLARDGGDIAEAEHYYRTRHDLNLRRLELGGVKRSRVLNDLVIDRERLGSLAWSQRDYAEAKRCFFTNAMYLINSPARDEQWPRKCLSTGIRLIFLAGEQRAHLSDVLSLLALLSKEFVAYLYSQASERFEHALEPFVDFHSNYLELVAHEAPDQIPEVLTVLKHRKLVLLVTNALKGQLHDDADDALRRSFNLLFIELRRLAENLDAD